MWCGATFLARKSRNSFSFITNDSGWYVVNILAFRLTVMPMLLGYDKLHIAHPFLMLALLWLYFNF